MRQTSVTIVFPTEGDIAISPHKTQLSRQKLSGLAIQNRRTSNCPLEYVTFGPAADVK